MTDILRLATPLAFWLATFSGIYGLQGLVCSPRWEAAGLDLATGRGLILLGWALALSIQLSLLLALRTPRFASRSRFVQLTSLSLAATALAATAWTLLPAAAVSICL